VKPGDKVRLRANPSRVGILTGEYDGPLTEEGFLFIFSMVMRILSLRGLLKRLRLRLPDPMN